MISLLSVRITVSTFGLINCARRQTCSIIGLPKKSFSTLPGNLSDSSRAGITIPVKDKRKLNFIPQELEEDLIKITTNWSDSLLDKLCEKYGEYEGGLKHKQLEFAFPPEYKHKFNASATIEDINNLKKASDLNKTVFNLLQKSPSEFILKIYSPSVFLTLSDTLPAIENLGFIAIDEQSFIIKETAQIKQSWIYEFILASHMERLTTCLFSLKLLKE
jgi:NAD-specific glutamate dehydrogenase